MNERVEVVEYLRGFAALAVTWFHLTNTYPLGWVNMSGSFGYLGVSIFFVISGYVIPLSLSLHYKNYGPRQFVSFLLRRMVRLEPPYLASIVLVLVLWHLSSLAPSFSGPSPSYSLGQITVHFLYIIPFTSYDWLQPVYWTLAFEFVFYTGVALLFPLIGKERVAFWMIACLGLFAFVGFRGSPYFLLFSLGFSVYRLRSDQDVERFIDVAAIVLSIVLLFVYAGIPEACAGVLAASIIHFARRFRFQSHTRRVLLSLGAVSYSLYLIHVPIGGRVVNLGRRFGESALFNAALSIFALLVCLLVAYLFWRLIERPSIAAARRLFPTDTESR